MRRSFSVKFGAPSTSTSMLSSNTGDKKSEDDSRYDILNGLAQLPYHERLTRFLCGSARHRGISVVEFRPLYNVALHDLQQQLTGVIQKVEEESVISGQSSRIRETLHKYNASNTNSTEPLTYPTFRDFKFIHASR